MSDPAGASADVSASGLASGEGQARELGRRPGHSGRSFGRGIATRIAVAALASAAVGLAILSVGITVVGAEVFRALMVEAGDSAEHAQAMYDESVTSVVLVAVIVAAVASVVLAVILAR